MPGVGNYDVQYTILLKEKLDRQFAAMERSANSFTNRLGKGLEGVAGMINPVALGIGALGLGLKKSIEEAMNFEQLNVQMEVMLGSVSKSKKMIADLNEFGKRTPFEVSGLTESAATLLAYGRTQEQVMSDLQMLGDISGGNAEKLKFLTMAFGQVNAAGKLTGQDLKQFINVGFNPLYVMAEDLSEMNGKTLKQSYEILQKQMSKGQISVEMVEEAMRKATSEGGKFNGMMDKQSETMKGRWSTAMDNVNAQLRNIGLFLIPQMTQGLKGFSQFMEGDFGVGYLNWMKGVTQTINPIGWAWKGIENAVSDHGTVVDESRIKYNMLGDAVLDASKLTESQLNVALKNANDLYGFNNKEMEYFISLVDKMKQQKELTNADQIANGSIEDLKMQIDELEKLQGKSKDNKQYQSYQKDILARQKQIEKITGKTNKKTGGGFGMGGHGEGTSISSRAPQYYTINIDQLVGAIYTKKESLNESDIETQKKVTETIVRALNDTQLIATQ